MENSVLIEAKGKSDAIELINENGFIDITPDLNFYSWYKRYQKNDKKYFFGGWTDWDKNKREFKKIKMNLVEVDMELKEFAKMINGRQYGYRMLTKEELQLAKDNGIVIVTGASDDLVELEGAITDEGECWEGGKICIKATPDGGIVHNCERSDVFSFIAKWCKDKDESGNIISWTYDVPIEHETFMIYEDDAPYCKGFVFKI